jgi:hypothetical protein
MSPLKNFPIEDIKSRFATVALDNTYQVEFNLNQKIVDECTNAGMTIDFLTEDLGLYVTDAVIPGSSFADIEVSGDRQGITERIPFTRIYDDITLTFLVDREYNVLKFFEIWNQLVNPSYGTNPNISVMRLNYPTDYKCGFTIHKFNKDRFLGDVATNVDLTFDIYKRATLTSYRVLKAWPYSVASTPVNYEGQNLLQLNVTFRYDRFTIDRVNKLKLYPGYLDGASYVYFVELSRPNGETYQVPLQDGRPTQAQLQELIEFNQDIFKGPNVNTP